jgi:hypothetical protein
MVVRKDTDADREAVRVAIARHLAEAGPTDGSALTAALGRTPTRFWALVNHPWFRITGKGWELTDQGWVEALA